VYEDRGAYIAAAITIARAYLAAGHPTGVTPLVTPLAGFLDWSRVVREPLIWLGEEDPVKSMEEARREDPERALANELLWRWESLIGINQPVSAREIITTAETPKDRSSGYQFPRFRDLLMEQVPAPRGNAIDPVRLGRWLQKIHGQVYDGLRIDKYTRTGTVNQYVLTRVDDEGADDKQE
jgi:putative DNA primase/helicase